MSGFGLGVSLCTFGVPRAKNDKGTHARSLGPDTEVGPNYITGGCFDDVVCHPSIMRRQMSSSYSTCPEIIIPDDLLLQRK